VTDRIKRGAFSCGDVISFFISIESGDIRKSQTGRFVVYFSGNCVAGNGVAITSVEGVHVNYGKVENGAYEGDDDDDDYDSPGRNSYGYDYGIWDNGNSRATLVESYFTKPPFVEDSLLVAVVKVTNIEHEEHVIIRIDVRVCCTPNSSPYASVVATLDLCAEDASYEYDRQCKKKTIHFDVGGSPVCCDTCDLELFEYGANCSCSNSTPTPPPPSPPTPNNSSNNCSDNNACTNDFVDPVTGLCNSTLLVCNDSNLCTLDLCFNQTGCDFSIPVNCSDNNSCTIESCSPSIGCVNTPINCNDNNSCTNDSCINGTCINIPINCLPDNVTCTDDFCDPTLGCVHVPENALCYNDVDCDIDICNPILGCQYIPNCNDNNACTIDTCDADIDACTNIVNTSLCESNVSCISGACNPVGNTSFICSFTAFNSICGQTNGCLVPTCTSEGCVTDENPNLCPFIASCETPICLGVNSTVSGACSVTSTCPPGAICTVHGCVTLQPS